jgi:hypothetical protein
MLEKLLTGFPFGKVLEGWWVVQGRFGISNFTILRKAFHERVGLNYFHLQLAQSESL